MWKGGVQMNVCSCGVRSRHTREESFFFSFFLSSWQNSSCERGGKKDQQGVILVLVNHFFLSPGADFNHHMTVSLCTEAQRKKLSHWVENQPCISIKVHTCVHTDFLTVNSAGWKGRTHFKPVVPACNWPASLD